MGSSTGASDLVTTFHRINTRSCHPRTIVCSSVLSMLVHRVPPAYAYRPPTVHVAVGRAALSGAAWGVAARLWMRFISDDPEFSISGTAFIVAAPTVISMFSVLAQRCISWSGVARWPARMIAGASTVLLGMGAGMLMLPTLILGGVAYGHPEWPRQLRLTIAVLAAVPVVVVVREIPPGGRIFLALPTYLLLIATIIPVYARIYNPAKGRPIP